MFMQRSEAKTFCLEPLDQRVEGRRKHFPAGPNSKVRHQDIACADFPQRLPQQAQHSDKPRLAVHRRENRPGPSQHDGIHTHARRDALLPALSLLELSTTVKGVRR